MLTHSTVSLPSQAVSLSQLGRQRGGQLLIDRIVIRDEDFQSLLVMGEIGKGITGGGRDEAIIGPTAKSSHNFFARICDRTGVESTASAATESASRMLAIS